MTTLLKAAEFCDELLRRHQTGGRPRTVKDLEANGTVAATRVLLQELQLPEGEFDLFVRAEAERVTLISASLRGGGVGVTQSLLARGIAVGAAYERLRASREARAER